MRTQDHDRFSDAPRTHGTPDGFLVATIFDALTARDRPYKKAVPINHSLAILEDEARQGKLDADIVPLWIESRAWEDIVAS